MTSTEFFTSSKFEAPVDKIIHLNKSEHFNKSFLFLNSGDGILII